MINNNLTGSTVKSPLVPAGSNATHYDMFGVGGYREVDTLNDLQCINSKLLLTGCLVYVRSENEIYKYGNSGNFEILNYDKWKKLQECIKNIKDLQLEDINIWKAINTNTLSINKLTTNLNSLDFKNYELSLNQSSDKNSVVLTYKKDNSTITADLPIATKNTPGEIKLGDSTTLNSINTKNYPVLLDDNNRAYVNVPWSDTITKNSTYKVALRAAPTRNSIVLSGSDNTESIADIPIASLALPGEIKLGNPNLSLSKGKHYPLEYNDLDGAFVQVPWTDTITNLDDIKTQFTSFVFTRSAINPGHPEGGSYDHPIPTGSKDINGNIHKWYDGVPDGKNPVWSSNAIFINKNITSVNWSDPILLTDSATIDVCYSESTTKPNSPTIHGILNDDIWHNNPTSNDIWMAMSTRTSLISDWGPWNIFKIKGEDGKNGNSIKIVGTYDNAACELNLLTNTTILKNINNSHIHYINTSHTKTVGDCLLIIDTCSKTTFNHHIMCLTDNTPETWIDLGGISGKNGIDGTSQYIHVKWSNNAIPDSEGKNTNVHISFTTNNGEDPGIFRGECITTSEEDPWIEKNPYATSLYYKWSRVKGLDGFSYWFFYTATETNTKPVLPTGNFDVADLYDNTLNNNGITWYDEIPVDTSIYDPETLYLWLIWARDDESPIYFRGPVLYAAPPSDGVAYNIVVNNEGLYWSSDDNCLTMDSTGKNLIITVYKNESELNFTSSPEYTLTAFVLDSNKSTHTSITIVNNSTIEFNNINPNIHYPLVFIDLNKSGHLVYEYLYNIPVEGRTGPLGILGPPGKADTGITIMLSNDVAHLPCNPDNSPIERASVTTDIEVFKGDTNVTNSVALGSDSNTQNSTSTSQSGFSYDHSAIHNIVSYSNGKYTLTSTLNSTDNNYLYLIPIYIRYNGYVYTKYFTIRKDYTGDVYELIVTPQVYTDKDTDKTLNIKVNRTYSRTGHTTGVITSTGDPEYENLKITINDDSNKLPLIGYTTTKLDLASFDVKLYEKKPNTLDEYNLIDEEVVSRVVGTQGALGIQGCILRNRGYWNSEVTDYVNDGEYAPESATEIRYIDYAFLKGTDKCYKVKYAHEIPSHNGVANGKVTVKDSTSPDKSEYWTEATSLEFAYIKDLIALLISALTITADEFLVKRENNLIVAGMIKGDTTATKNGDNIVFFAGTSETNVEKVDTTKAKTYITEGGKLHSEEAEITGAVTASLLIVSSNTTPSETKPSIIFTTYKPSATINTYNDSGTIVKSEKMDSFNNIKDSSGNTLQEGSPIGIVYKHNVTAQLYLPIYFFDFAPLTVNTASSVPGYYFNLGDSNQATILSYNGKYYKNSTDSSNLLSGDIWSKRDNVYISDSEGHLQEACIWFCKKASNGDIDDTSTYKWGVQRKYTYISANKISYIDGLAYSLYERSDTSVWLTITNATYDNIKNSSDQYPTSSTNYNTLHFMKDYRYPIYYNNGNTFYFKLLSYGYYDTYNHPAVLDLDYLNNTNAQIIKFSSSDSTSYPQSFDINSGEIIMGIDDLHPETQSVANSSDIYTKVYYLGIDRNGYDHTIGKE